jgi:hypothetical protein
VLYTAASLACHCCDALADKGQGLERRQGGGEAVKNLRHRHDARSAVAGTHNKLAHRSVRSNLHSCRHSLQHSARLPYISCAELCAPRHSALLMHMMYMMYVMSCMQGGAQLAADVEYFCNVMSALQVSRVTCCPPPLAVLQTDVRVLPAPRSLKSEGCFCMSPKLPSCPIQSHPCPVPVPFDVLDCQISMRHMCQY